MYAARHSARSEYRVIGRIAVIREIAADRRLLVEHRTPASREARGSISSSRMVPGVDGTESRFAIARWSRFIIGLLRCRQNGIDFRAESFGMVGAVRSCTAGVESKRSLSVSPGRKVRNDMIALMVASKSSRVETRGERKSSPSASRHGRLAVLPHRQQIAHRRGTGHAVQANRRSVK